MRWRLHTRDASKGEELYEEDVPNTLQHFIQKDEDGHLVSIRPDLFIWMLTAKATPLPSRTKITKRPRTSRERGSIGVVTSTMKERLAAMVRVLAPTPVRMLNLPGLSIPYPTSWRISLTLRTRPKSGQRKRNSLRHCGTTATL